jgi:hypothetical protein
MFQNGFFPVRTNLAIDKVKWPSQISGSVLRQINCSKNGELTEMLAQADGLVDSLEMDGVYPMKDRRLLRRNKAAHEGGRIG